jgi:hypothetical protein
MSGLGVLISLLAWVIRVIPKVSQQWIRTGIQVENLTQKIADVIQTERVAHDDIERRIDRHEDSHNRR